MSLNSIRDRFGKACFVCLLSFCFSLFMFWQPAPSMAAGSDIYQNTEINRILDENYQQVQENGYAKLSLPPALHGLKDSDFSPNSLKAARTLIAAGHEAYIIGGAVRDIIMGKEANDFDVVTSATNEEIAALLPKVTFHAIQTGQEYGIAHYENEDVDVATFSNIPYTFYGKKGIPDFDPKAIYGKDALSDSFQRDLTINAIYYDVATGNLIDYHGGIRDIREKQISTMAAANLTYEYKPSNALRALRFKSRYGFTLRQDVDSAIKEHIGEYIANMQGRAFANEIKKMSYTGYTRECFKNLLSYGVIENGFPPVTELCRQKSYQDYMATVTSMLDEAYQNKKKDPVYKNCLPAAILYPAVLSRMEAGASFENSMKEVLDQEYKLYRFKDEERQSIEGIWRLEQELRHERDKSRLEMLRQNQYYPAASILWVGNASAELNALQHTDIFLPSALRHIFLGDYKHGIVGGCHYANLNNPCMEVFKDTKTIMGKQGAYLARVKLNGIMKQAYNGYSTFFPDSYSPQQAIDAINEAYQSRVKVPGTRNLYLGISKDGLEIEMYVTEDGKIVSAFPREIKS